VSEHQDPAVAADVPTDPAAEDELAAAVVGAFPSDGPAASDGGAADGEPTGGSVHTELAEIEDDPRTREELLTAAHEAERQRDEYLDDLRRARAEFENFRRRTGRESATARDAGKADVAVSLLDVLDDLDRTLEAADGSTDETLAKGVSLVAEKLVTTLRGLGLERLEPNGASFDPALHEAVQQVPADGDGDEATVERTLRPGYRLGERVLRPAMVVVKG
jgi:molecular chaperone GrpE